MDTMQASLGALSNQEALFDLMLALGLSAACGFRVFIPLLALSMAAVLGHIDLPSSFDWVESKEALVIFAIASLLEVAGYFIPWFDHLLDVIATPAAVIAGSLITASLTPEMDPAAKWALAVIAGGGTAGATKGLLNALRVGSTTVSGGLTNPILAGIELVLAIALSFLALTLPVLTVVLLIGAALMAIYLLRRFFKVQAKSAEMPSSDVTAP